MILGPLAGALESLSPPPPKEKEEDEDEDEGLFLPFPFTTEQVPSPPYRGTDPEWQEFMKISKDRDLVQTVRGRP